MSRKKTEESNSDLDNFILSMQKSLKAKDDEPVESFISTGSTLLDYTIANRRNGGIPVGRLTEISGEESSGKTLIAAHILANTQKLGGIAVYIDTEHSAQAKFMRRLGLDWDRVIKPKPTTIEETFKTMEEVIIQAREYNEDKPLTIVWDSIAATPPLAEIEGNYDPNSLMGVAAKAMSKGMRKLTEAVDYCKVTMVFLNQLRYKMQLEHKYADPWVTPYGKAVPFHASIRVRLNSFTKVKASEDKDAEVIGIWTRAHIKKSKIGPPERKAEFPILFASGIDDAGSIYDYLHTQSLLSKEKGKSTLTLNGKEHTFPHEDWGTFFKEHNKEVGDLLEKLLVIDYDKNEQPVGEEKEDSDTES